MISPEKTVEIKALASIIDDMDYYQILKVERNASPQTIKRAFHEESREFHPDSFYQEDDASLKEAVHIISKRITEAYSVLRDHVKRTHYDKAISGPDRKNHLRFISDVKTKIKDAREEEIGKTPKGREYYRRGMAAMERRQFEEAEKNFKLAISFEPGNDLFQEKLKEARNKIKIDNPFWIK